MNKQIIIGVGVIIIVGIGGGFYFSSQSKEPLIEKEAGVIEGVVEEKTTAIIEEIKNIEQASVAKEEPKELTKTEQVTARSFAEKILKLFQNRDFGKVYDLLTEEDRATISKTEYVKDVTEAFSSTTITSWQIKEVLDEQNGASVQYVVNYLNPILGVSSATDILTLVQKNGKWLLSIGVADVANTIIKGLGDEVVLATAKLKVNSVKEQQVISNKYSSTTAKEGTKFIVIDMSITNITKTGFYFPTEAFILTDNNDREFKTYKNTIGNIDNYLDVRELSPSIPERGVLVYEVPVDAISYSFMLSKSGTNEVYKIILK